MSTNRGIILLAAMVVGLVALALSLERGKARTSYGIDFKRVRWIEISNQHGRFTLENTAYGRKQEAPSLQVASAAWHLRGYMSVAMNQNALKSLLHALSGFGIVDEFDLDEADHEAAFGLNPPQAVLVIQKGEETVRISFGDWNNYLKKRYVTIDDTQQVGLASDHLFQLISQPRTYFLDLRLFPFAAAKINEIRIERGGEVDHLRQVRGGWTINGKAADLPFVEGFLKNLESLRGWDVCDEHGDYGFGMPRLKLVIKGEFGSGGEKDEVQILVGSQAEVAGGPERLYYALSREGGVPFLISQASLKGVSPRREVLMMEGG